MTLALSMLHFLSNISVNINFETISKYTEKWCLKRGAVHSLLDMSPVQGKLGGIKGSRHALRVK